MPAVSILMPVRNGGRDLALAVRSIIDQGFTDWELLLIDDGSTDGAVAGLDTLADPRICVRVDGANKGLAARLNEGIDLARAPLIARMDHDDFAHPDRLSAQVEFLAHNQQIDLLGTRCVTMDEEGHVFGELPFAETHEAICGRPWLGFHLAHPTWMGRAAWFQRNRYAVPAPYACEDQELLLRASAHSRYHALPIALLAYRVRSSMPPQKLAQTRSAMLGVQREHFLSNGKPLEAALSTLVYGVRSVSDALRTIAPRARSDMRTADVSSVSGWQTLIDNARSSVS